MSLGKHSIGAAMALAFVFAAACGQSAPAQTAASESAASESSGADADDSKVRHNPKVCKPSSQYCLGRSRTNTGLTFRKFALLILRMEEVDHNMSVNEFLELNQWDGDRQVPKGIMYSYVYE